MYKVCRVSVVNIPSHLLVVTYAVIQFLLHMTKQFLGGKCLSLSLLLICPIPAVLLWYDVCLSDIQQCRSELLQLTAGDTHQRRVQA